MPAHSPSSNIQQQDMSQPQQPVYQESQPDRQPAPMPADYPSSNMQQDSSIRTSQTPHQPVSPPAHLCPSTTHQDPQSFSKFDQKQVGASQTPQTLYGSDGRNVSSINPVQTCEPPKSGDSQVMGTPADPDSHPHNGRVAATSIRNDNVEEQHRAQQSGEDNYSYVQNPSSTQTQGQGTPAKAPMESFTDTLNKWGKKAENVTGNVFTHCPNMADTAWGRISLGTKVLTQGGLINVFKQTFPSSPNEQLLKSYACYLSTSTEPVPGTLYISSHKFAFCSDRPLPATRTSGEESWSYYKIILPLEKVQAVNPSQNKKKPEERYIHVTTLDQHEFWFMGFVNYDKGLKNMQEAAKTGGQKHVVTTEISS